MINEWSFHIWPRIPAGRGVFCNAQLGQQLDLIQRIGLELYTQMHVGGLESEH